MATTTNYGWTTPDDTALVKDGAAAIRTLGSSVDTTTKALNPSTTLGDIEYRSSTANTNTRLGIGSTGNVLTVAGGVPTWAAPAGGGKVLQVVQGTLSGYVGTGSTSYVDTGLSVSITPSSATSKVLVFAAISALRKEGGVSTGGGKIRLVRTSTSIFVAGDALLYDTESIENWGSSAALNYLDSPATTSATTYKIQYATKAGASEFAINYYFTTNDIMSTIIAMEIGA